MKRKLMNAAAILAAAILAGLGVATVTVGGTPAAAMGQAGHAVYQWPADQVAAARACYQAEREARGIPGDHAAYVAWWHAHEGTQARADWSTAYAACQAQHLTVDRWDYANLIKVSGG